MKKNVKITKISYYPWEQGGFRFHFAHNQYDAETGNYVGSYAPGVSDSVAVLQQHGYSTQEIEELIKRTRDAEDWAPVPLPRPLQASMIF